MFHHVARAVPGRALFLSWVEARSLWDRLAPLRPVALVLMPDHLHLQHQRDVRAELVQALGAHARWVGVRRDVRGPLVRGVPAPQPLATRDKVRRTERYIALNPVRAGLADDALGWPFSSHRDAVGLALPLVREPARDAARYHQWVSTDHEACPGGTELPARVVRSDREPGLDLAVVAAVGALTRTPAGVMARRGPTRSLLIRSLRALTTLPAPRIAEVAEVGLRTVWRYPDLPDPEVRAVERVLFDPRFAELRDGDLRSDRMWWRYRGLR